MFNILKTFYKFAAQKRLAFAGFIVLVIITTILGDLTPYFYKLFIDEIPHSNYQKLLWILIGYTVVRVFRLIFHILGNVAGDFNLVDAAVSVRSKIFKQVQDLDFVFHSNKSTGSLISIFKRGDAAFFSIFDAIHHRILETITGMIVMFYFFFTVDIKLMLAAIISMILTSLAAKFLLDTNLAKRIEFNNQEDNISGVITDNMINYETVKLFAKEGYEQERLENKFTAWKKALWDFANSFRVVDLTIGSIINVGIFAILFFSLNEISSGKINIGDFVLVTAFINNFIPRLWDLTWSFKDISKNYADIEKYFGLLDYEIEVKDPENPIKMAHVEGKIELDNVTFKYKGRNNSTIRKISLDIKKGQSIALVGRSGSGKTTIAKLLMRFFDLSSGHISIDDIDITKFTKSDLRSFIGVVPQEPILFNNTIAYNIGYGKPGVNLNEIKLASKLANINNFIEGLPKKYDTEVGERGVKLSGGQKQRLAIARMILSDPDIVIFDEATSHLDSESEKLIQDAFWKARRGKTTIIIAHRLSTIMRADKIVVMEYGKIKEAGTHEELLKNKESLYSHFWNLQIKLD